MIRCFSLILPTILLLLASSTSNGEEVPIYRGKVFKQVIAAAFTAGGKIADGNGPSFQEIYYVDSEAIENWEELDLEKSRVPMTVDEASKAISKKFNLDRVTVLEAKLINLEWEQGNKEGSLLRGKHFYFLTISKPQEIVSYVVLFDGSVIEPRKEKIK